MNSRVFKALTLTCSAALAACTQAKVTDATEIIVVIDSDQELKTQLASVSVEVRDEAGKSTASTHDFDLHDKTKLPLSFGIAQPSSGADWFMLLARGLDGDGKELVEYKVIAHFEAHKTGHLEVLLSSACAGNFCDGHADQTCNAKTGDCETVTRTPTPVAPAEDAGRVLIEDGGPSAPEASTSTTDGGPKEAGSGDSPEAGTDAGTVMTTTTPPVPPSLAGAATFGGRRTDGTIAVYDDGFEEGARLCTADGQYCVTGGFMP